MHMSLEVLEQLESKVQSAVDNISLLKMELDELKEQNSKLQDENHQLRNEHVAWQNVCVPCWARWTRWAMPSDPV